jgi:predicted dehydrogenase
LMREGKIGEAVMIEANLSSDTGFAIQPGDWRSSPTECASGPLIQLGIHHADTLQYLLGRVKTVSGFQKRVRLKTEIMDTTGTLVEFENGCLGYIGNSYITPRTCRIVLYGTAGQIFYDDRLGLHLYSKEEARQIDLEPSDRHLRINATLVEEVGDFADSIVLGKQPEVSIFEGLRALAVVEAARLSLLWNRPVAIDELIHFIK